MIRKKVKVRLLYHQQQFSLQSLLIFGLVFAAIGGYLLYRSFAATTLGTALPARMPESSGTKTIYMSTTGSDANAGTLASPYRNLDYAVNQASSGSIIYIRGGTYPNSVQLYNKKFSATNPVTVTNYPGETAKFTGDGLIDMFYFSNDTGIRLRGLELANNSDTMAGTQAGSAGAAIGLKVYDSQDIELDHLFVHNNGSTVGGQGVLVSGGDGCTTCTHDYDADVQIWNSRFTANGKDPAGQHSVYFGGGPVGPLGTQSNNVIANNVIYDQPNGYALHIGDNADGVYIVNNTIYHTFGYQYGAAMALWNHGPDQAVNTHDLKVYNNLMVDNNNGIAGSGWVSQVNNIVDYNYASGTVGTGVPCTPNCSYSTMYGTDVTLYTLGTHNTVGSDPMFVSKAGHDFHLQSGSPARGMANPAYAPALDADGQARSATAPSLGAYEASSNKAGDLNGDNAVNITDLSILLSNYGTTNAVADINKDGTVNALDLSILLSNYGT